MNFTYWYSYFLSWHADYSQTHYPSPQLLHIYTINPLNTAFQKYKNKQTHTNMSNLYAHMPVKGQAYKDQNALEQTIPHKSAEKTYKSTHQYFHTLLPWCMLAFGSQAKLMLKRQQPCRHALNERRLTH